MCNGKTPSRDYFEITDVFLKKKRGSHVQSSHLPKFAPLFWSCPRCRVSGRGVTTSSLSCSSSWTTTRSYRSLAQIGSKCSIGTPSSPDPAMRVTLWALMGAGGKCHEYIQDTLLHLSFSVEKECISEMTERCLLGEKSFLQPCARLPLFRNLFKFLGPLACGHFEIRSLLRQFDGFRIVDGFAFPCAAVKLDLSSLSRSVTRPAAIAAMVLASFTRARRRAV